jgi:glycosyltransferase involved in cell wall biosynthesis
MLSKLNRDILADISVGCLTVVEMIKKPTGSFASIVKALNGDIDGIDTETTDQIFQLIHSRNIGLVFIDGSNFGKVVKLLKIRLPKLLVITFFHNVEARFFWGSLRQHKSLHALGVLVSNTLAERRAVKFSDKLICLSERDSLLLKRLYGRSATHIAPMVLEDKCPASHIAFSGDAPERFALFVGGTFYANRAGIEWYVREIVPRVNLPLYIVGLGFDALKAELEVPDKVVVVGAVDCLAEWYRRAQFVIAPIFDGSGMKTKVAEALMFGKQVVGTPEAFAGYGDITDKAGWVCESADEFVFAIKAASAAITQTFDPALREIYMQHHSMDAARKRLRNILE